MYKRQEKVQLSVLHADREAAALISSPSEAVRKQAEEMYGLKLEKPADREAEPSSEATESSATRRAPRKKTEQSTQSTRKPSARQVKTAIEKLDKDLREIQEIPQVKNRDKKLIKALEEFNSSAVPEKKGCDVESILKDCLLYTSFVEQTQSYLQGQSSTACNSSFLFWTYVQCSVFGDVI